VSGPTILRLAAVAGLLAAIGDPGCPRPRRPVIAVSEGGASSREAAARVRSRLAGAVAGWADVVGAARREAADLRVVVGDPGPVAADLQAGTAAIAVRPVGDALSIPYVSAPPAMRSGTRIDIGVAVQGVPAAGGRLIVAIVDRDSGREEARAERVATSAGDVRIVVPWLAMGSGRRVLRVRAHLDGDTGAREAVADLAVDVRAEPVPVWVIEARPAWGARFARLALASSPDVRLSSEVRTAPGLTVRTGPGDAGDALVLIVGGVDALTTGDVARLEAAVHDAGRVAVLLFDDAPRAGPWRRLWPERFGAPVVASRLHAVDLGGHVWKTREWLAPALSTQARPLAYSDSGSPVMVGRGVGAGRVVAITALDAWRWRAADGVAWVAGWQALVQRLAADVPAPLSVTSWVAGEGARRVVHADIRLRPDLARAVAATVTATVEGAATAPSGMPLWPAGAGRWRGATSLPSGRAATLRVAVGDGSVVPPVSVVVDLSAAATPATWADIERIQRLRGAEAVDEASVGPALQRWRDRTTLAAGERRFFTRQWWFAAVVLVLLGSEWILRRAQRLP
jgi:hypothetical protein